MYPPHTHVCVRPGAATGTGEPTVSLNGSPAKGPLPTHSRARSCTSHLPSSTSEPVQTQQPCSLKGSLSSDNIYAGLHGDSAATQAPPGQGYSWISFWYINKHMALWLTVLGIPVCALSSSSFLDYTTGWSHYPQPSERVTYKSSSKPRARFLSGPVSLSICLYQFSSHITSLFCFSYFPVFLLLHRTLFCNTAGFSFACPHPYSVSLYILLIQTHSGIKHD